MDVALRGEDRRGAVMRGEVPSEINPDGEGEQREAAEHQPSSGEEPGGVVGLATVGDARRSALALSLGGRRWPLTFTLDLHA